MCASTPTDAPFRLRALLVVQLAVTSTTDGFAAQLELERLRLQRAHVELDVQRERGLNLERENVNFYDNFTPIMVFTIAGTFLSAMIIGFGTWGLGAMAEATEVVEAAE